MRAAAARAATAAQQERRQRKLPRPFSCISLPMQEVPRCRAKTATLALSKAPMQAKPTVAPRDDASNAEEPAPTKMDDQHNKLKLMPVRTHKGRATQSPMAAACIMNRRESTLTRSRVAHNLPTQKAALLA